MTQKEKYEKLDKELRPKYEHLSDYEYQQVRAQYIGSRRRKILLRSIFGALVIPLVAGSLLVAFNVPALVTSLLVLVWMAVVFYRCHVERDELPELDAGLLTYQMISKAIGGSGLRISLILVLIGSAFAFWIGDDSYTQVWIIAAPVLLLLGIGSFVLRRWMWKTGKYRLVARKAVRKDYSEGDGEIGNTYWLLFDAPGGKKTKYYVSEAFYGDADPDDLYYLVLKKKLIGGEKILLCYKAELITLDDKLKAVLQK